MIDDLCANSDCSLSDECHPDFFESWDDWEDAHAGCYMEDGGGPKNENFYWLFTWNSEAEKWKRT